MPYRRQSSCALLLTLLTLRTLGGPAGHAAEPEPPAHPEHLEVTTPSGLRLTDLKVGQGAEATQGKVVDVRYTGWLVNGTKFDASEEGHPPLTFRLGAGDVIRGLDEGVTGMKEGGKRKLVIPPELGFGKTGGGGVIPPNATLVYEIELIAVR